MKIISFSEWLKDRVNELGGAVGPYISDEGGEGCHKHTDFQVSGACSDHNTAAGNEKIRNGGHKRHHRKKK